ncbi:hypothetical protein ACFL2Z_00565 [Candidatus Eisenbacteria bacterium]|uniref:DUF378 domain-containing protein n=1 Tax=Eiseniibacteriota bacterium TaxID=2212470 RepID=A0ABV6YMX5_UNCEI
MKQRVSIVAITIILNACLWGFAMIMSAHTLKGTGAYQQIQHILGGCAGASLILVSVGLGGLAKKPKQGE